MGDIEEGEGREEEATEVDEGVAMHS